MEFETQGKSKFVCEIQHANTKRRNFKKFPLFLIHCIKIVRGDVGKKYKKKKKKFEKRKFQKKKKSIRKDAD